MLRSAADDLQVKDLSAISPGDGEKASPGDGEQASPGDAGSAALDDTGSAALGDAGSAALGIAGSAALGVTDVAALGWDLQLFLFLKGTVCHHVPELSTSQAPSFFLQTLKEVLKSVIVLEPATVLVSAHPVLQNTPTALKKKEKLI
ncbi:hypothetical protein EOD39_7977 [Acipenser ruthenus]|uniref:Uncharacterized protein n=1 Tax=Acipenser ruthenus TaxID=7906 RepID=A0A662YWY2_ACIRT|nr:hypothetical protein EOD39_7977 [Acipenser ruthenus]